jgi:hypothetical protein
MDADKILDLAYRRAEQMRQEGKRVVLRVEPDERLPAAEAKLAEVRALADRWYHSDDSTFLDHCGRKLLELLDGPESQERTDG